MDIKRKASLRAAGSSARQPGEARGMHSPRTGARLPYALPQKSISAASPVICPSLGWLHVTAAVKTFLPQDVPAYLSLWCVNYNYFRCKGKGDEVSSIFRLGGPG